MSRPKRSVRSSAIEADEEEPVVSEPPKGRAPAGGLPSALPPFIQSAVTQAPQVAAATSTPFARKFTIPVSQLGYEWEKSGRSDRDRSFSLRGITPEMEQKAGDVAGMGGSVVVMIQHMQLLCVCKIGGLLTQSNHALITSWMHDIGKPGRMCLDRAYNKVNSATEDELATFLESEEPDFDF